MIDPWHLIGWLVAIALAAWAICAPIGVIIGWRRYRALTREIDRRRAEIRKGVRR